MTTPYISILIPVYNREKFIGRCIESALQQTYSNIEVIVVDNCSTDDTYNISKEYEKNDPRVHVYRNERNVGPVLNWKECINKAKGTYGKLLFSDDLISQNFIEDALTYIDGNNDVGFVFSSVCIGSTPFKGLVDYRPHSSSGIYPISSFINGSLFGGEYPVSPGCALFRLDDLKEMLMEEIPSPSLKNFKGHGAGVDYLIYLLTSTKYKSYGFIYEAETFFCVHDESITISDKTRIISDSYVQAKVWFTENNFSDTIVENVLSYYWLIEVAKNKKIISPKKYVSQFTVKNYKIKRFVFKSLLKILKKRVKKWSV